MSDATYDITVVEHVPNKPDLKTTFSGRGPSAAAMLRALANEIDPPKPVLREPGFPFNERGSGQVEATKPPYRITLPLNDIKPGGSL